MNEYRMKCSVSLSVSCFTSPPPQQKKLLFAHEPGRRCQLTSFHITNFYKTVCVLLRAFRLGVYETRQWRRGRDLSAARGSAEMSATERVLGTLSEGRQHLHLSRAPPTQANGVKEESKVAVLLTVIGARAYAEPGAAARRQFRLLGVLKQRYDPKPLVIADSTGVPRQLTKPSLSSSPTFVV